tara:strand:- start:777 stop:2612 length:1836 start_codon:yes stop_codon:yes gene_type:complete
MKRVFPYLMLILGIIISTFIWDYIKLPYNNENLIQGEFFTKKYNPKNEILRFLIFIFFPLILFLFFFINKSENYDFLPWKNNFFLKKELNQKISNRNINIFTFFLILIIFIDFISLEFKNYNYPMDVFHEGTFLVPPINYLNTGKFWLSTIYDYGFIANNLGLIFLKIFDNFSIGLVRFSHLFLFFLNKIILIFICRKICLNINLKENLKIVLFILLSFFIISLSHYNITLISTFDKRMLLFLIFFLFLIYVLTEAKNNKINSIILGVFSVISILWYIDVGFYTNAVLSILLIYLILEKEYKKFIYIFISIILSWIIFFSLIPESEFKELLEQTKFVATISSYLLGLEFPKPFSEGSTRATRALMLIILSGVLLINFLFNKKININYNTKITLIFLFISAIIFFNSALMRTDTPHIKYSSGLYKFLIFFCLLYFFVKYLEKKTYLSSYISFLINKKFYVMIFILIVFVCNIFISDNKKIKNVFFFKNNIEKLISFRNEIFLSEEMINLVDRFSKISIEDKCVQIFTDDISLPFFLNKPTCTQYYIPAHIINGFSEENFIKQLEKNLPNFIIYSSPINWLSNKKNMPNANNFILKNYSLFEKIHNWEIYKLN